MLSLHGSLIFNLSYITAPHPQKKGQPQRTLSPSMGQEQKRDWNPFFLALEMVRGGGEVWVGVVLRTLAGLLTNMWPRAASSLLRACSHTDFRL